MFSLISSYCSLLMHGASGFLRFLLKSSSNICFVKPTKRSRGMKACSRDCCTSTTSPWSCILKKFDAVGLSGMRMPNPAYRVDGTSLRVYEKSNYKEEYLGGDKGFEFPRCVESKHNSGLVWDGLAKKSKVTKKTGADGAESYSVDGIISLCAPWAGVVKGPKEGYTYHPGDVKEVAPTANRVQTLYWVPNTDRKSVV